MLKRAFVGVVVLVISAGVTAAGPLEDVAEWYRLAANRGYPTAQFDLGVFYSKGEGVPQDDLLAYMWFDLAAAQGDADAVKARDFTSARMTSNQIAEAQRLARDWKPIQD